VEYILKKYDEKHCNQSQKTLYLSPEILIIEMNVVP